MPRKRSGFSGPYKHGNRWRVVCQADGARTVTSYETEGEAQRVVDAGRAAVEGETVSDALDRWLKIVESRGRRPLTISTLRNAVTRIAKFLPAKVHDVTPAAAGKAYAALVASGCAVDTHRNSLNVARSMWSQLKLGPNPWASIVGVGRRVKGKDQLTIDESRRFLAACLERGQPGDIAAALCLALALRAGEVVALRARDIDDGGRVLWVQRGKTEAARRLIEVPEVLRGPLSDLAARRTGRLFPYSRGWVGYHVGTARAAASVSRVSPHGLRGTHSTVASSAGATAHVVAQQLGHGSAAVTRDHYIAPGAEQSGTAARLGTILVTTGTKPRIAIPRPRN